MSVIRVNKTENYTVMSNAHFKDKRLSLKAKGLLSQMLSLPEDWDYTVAGLVSINKEAKSAIQSTLRELEAAGYLVRTRTQDKKGHFDYIYDIYEEPSHGEPRTENQFTDNPCTENQLQLNTNNKILNNKVLNDKVNKESSRASRFLPPTVEEVKTYCLQRNNGIDPQQFVDFYTAKGWKIGNNPMKDWKAAVRTWESRRKDSKPQLDAWTQDYLKDL
jgi:hypothetical protein